jgi:hypothetical protein
MADYNENAVKSLYKSVPLPVESRCIRILDIHPSGNRQDPIEGTLRVVDLDTNPTFSALSYVWGVDIAPSYIKCKNASIKVTQNCLSALQHLRQIDRTLAVWIDAICINQMDKTERSHQLPLMGHIYTCAYQTFIWLGEGTDISDQAMDMMSQAKLPESFSTRLQPSESSPRSPPSSWQQAFSLYRTSWNPISKPFICDSESHETPLLYLTMS